MEHLKGKCAMPNRKLNEEIINCITEAFIDLLSDRDFNEINIVDIIRHAGVSRNSFYRNFSSKEDILVRHISRTTDEFVDSNTIPVLETPWEDYIAGLLIHLNNHRVFLEILERNGKLHLISRITDDTIIRRTQGKLDCYHQAFLSGGLFNLYKFWAENGYKPEPSEVGRIFSKEVLGL